MVLRPRTIPVLLVLNPWPHYFAQISALTVRMMSMSSTAPQQSRRCLPKGRIVVVGSANYDMTSYTAKLPVLGETLLGERFETSCGGKGANQAIAAARLQLAEVSLVCRLGPDVLGTSLLQHLKESGVYVPEDAIVVRRDSQSSNPPDHLHADQILSSGVAAITVETTTGDNCIVVTPGANACMTPEVVETSLDPLLLSVPQSSHAAEVDAISVVMVQLEIPFAATLQALKRGKQYGAMTIFNPAPAPRNLLDVLDFLPYTDILILNESELFQLTALVERSTASEQEEIDKEEEEEEVIMAQRLLNHGVSTAVVVTLGARGAVVVRRCSMADSATGDVNDQDDSIVATHVCAPDDVPCRNDPVVDTVGAGDAFCGALASYLSAGLDLIEASTRACGIAGISVRRRGASFPSYDELPSSLQLIDSTIHSSIIEKNAKASKSVITFVTGNANKLREAQQILAKEGELPFDVVNQAVDLPELQGDDPAEIAMRKCQLAAEHVRGAVFTEDTSLCFNAMAGLPGPYIKWFLDKLGHEGLNAMLSGFDNKTAYAQTIVAFTLGPGHKIHVFDGRTDGTIVHPRGSLDFGWDPIFQPFELGGAHTYAEMSKEEKNSISHRARSFAKLHKYLARHSEEIQTMMKI